MVYELKKKKKNYKYIKAQKINLKKNKKLSKKII
jgi:hypothetical protein